MRTFENVEKLNDTYTCHAPSRNCHQCAHFNDGVCVDQFDRRYTVGKLERLLDLEKAGGELKEGFVIVRSSERGTYFDEPNIEVSR